MAFMLAHYHHDFDEWKSIFDSDPVGRAQGGVKAHSIARGVDDRNDIFVRLEFDSVATARAFGERLLSSGVLDSVSVRTPPTVVDVVDTGTY
jgi:hypothetical protein